jgi:hypothetical protein
VLRGSVVHLVFSPTHLNSRDKRKCLEEEISEDLSLVELMPICWNERF